LLGYLGRQGQAAHFQTIKDMTIKGMTIKGMDKDDGI